LNIKNQRRKTSRPNSPFNGIVQQKERLIKNLKKLIGIAQGCGAGTIFKFLVPQPVKKT
jgi:hypothetical protein